MYFIKFLLFFQQIINLNKKGDTALYRNYFVNTSFVKSSLFSPILTHSPLPYSASLRGIGAMAKRIYSASPPISANAASESSCCAKIVRPRITLPFA